MFFTSKILSFAFHLTEVAQNLTFVGQKFADKCHLVNKHRMHTLSTFIGIEWNLYSYKFQPLNKEIDRQQLTN